jgi:hypothetical protein
MIALKLIAYGIVLLAVNIAFWVGVGVIILALLA